jgi:hypothetical protein
MKKAESEVELFDLWERASVELSLIAKGISYDTKKNTRKVLGLIADKDTVQERLQKRDDMKINILEEKRREEERLWHQYANSVTVAEQC